LLNKAGNGRFAAFWHDPKMRDSVLLVVHSCFALARLTRPVGIGSEEFLARIFLPGTCPSDASTVSFRQLNINKGFEISPVEFPPAIRSELLGSPDHDERHNPAFFSEEC
jgi:hypothetical protein